MKKLAVIPCGSKKIWDVKDAVGPVPAKQAYISTFHCLCEQYAETFCDQWVVLSAKYGYLLPTDIVKENYNVTFGMKNVEVVSNQFLQDQIYSKQLDQYQELVILTGKKYKPYIFGSFSDDHLYKFPLQRCKGIGYMQQLLKQSIRSGRPII
ncbi:DUF6884 domain-containing protein [Radiobacillus sp. PE A8.2]|uniref:DUF6884 domain-containing protein n=1 Tax=Radiobacillus sp. PE A8.2 TaxID=3380349 RepID=UPI00388F6602